MRKLGLVGVTLFSLLLLSALTATAAFAQDDTQTADQNQAAAILSDNVQVNAAECNQTAVAVSGDATAVGIANEGDVEAESEAEAENTCKIKQSNEVENEIDQEQNLQQILDSIVLQ